MKKVVIWVGVIATVFGGLIWLNQSKKDDSVPSMTFAAVTQDVAPTSTRPGISRVPPIGVSKICRPVSYQM